ncbi:SAYSvFN domain-containing protein 1-like [Pecten maximus]|uniref:SAYSvFN domain-containing protein 1-like n=1 Tax=Pecten maximus TaxID=6579 RepID=UPI001458FCC4|nr:SAYSvFN domain-containing protein 1-like [Pecten maximus]
MEAKLAEYRARKAKETARQDGSQSGLISNLLRRNKTTGSDNPQSKSESQNDKTSATMSTKDDQQNQQQQQQQQQEVIEEEVPEPRVWDKLTILEFGLKCVLWLALWGLFVEIQFGAVFVLLSALFFLYRSLSNRKRKKNKLSAYSVFNPNFERLDGTFTAEQFEQELRYGPSSVR